MRRLCTPASTLSLLAIVLAACSSDKPSGPETGFLVVRAFIESSLPRDVHTLPPADSLLLRITDSAGDPLADQRVAIPDSAATSVGFDLAPGANYEVIAQAEGLDAGVRGAVYSAHRSGVTVERAQTTEVILLLLRAVARAPVIDGSAGRSSYTVLWDHIDDATGYLLREAKEGGSFDYVTSDTSWTFTPGLPRGFSRLLADDDGSTAPIAGGPQTTTRSYRVRVQLPLGNSLFSDSSAVDLDLWFDLPAAVAVSPADSAEGVGDTTTVRVAFDRPMDASTLQDTLVSLQELDTGLTVECAKEVEPGNAAVVLTPVERLTRGRWYRLRVSTGVKDESGRPLDQDRSRDGLQAFVSDFRTEEYDPLRVIEVVPADGAIGVEPRSVILVRFNRGVATDAAESDQHFFVSDSSGVVPGSRRRLDGGRTLEFRATAPFVHDIQHEIVVETSLVDELRGEPLDQDPQAPGYQRFLSGFRTMPQPRGPRVVGSRPIPGEPNHPVFEDMEIEFDRPIDPATVTEDALQVKVTLGGSEYNISGQRTTTADSLRVIFRPAGDLERDKPHRILVVASETGIRDAKGDRFDQQPSTPGFQDHSISFQSEQSVQVTRVDPTNGEQSVAWDDSVRVWFGIPIQAETAIDADNFALYAGETRLPATTVVSEDNLRATLFPLSPLSSYKVYRVVVGPGIRSWRGGRLDQNYNQDGYQEFTSTFRTVAETDPPQVLEVNPSDGTNGFPVEGSIQVFFSEPVRVDLLPEYFYVTRDDSLGARVDGRVRAGEDSLSARFEPDSSLAFFTVYHVHVETWIRDRFDNRLDQDLDAPGWQKFHSVFRTRNETDPPFVLEITPPDGSIGVGQDAAVTIDFSEPMDRGSLAVGVSIETDGAPVSGSLVFQNGDQRVVWTSGAPLIPDHLYRVRVDSLALDLAGNRFDQVPLTAPLDPFESEFRTEADTLGPYVESVAPADASTGVSIEIHPTVVFNEPVNPATINGSSVALVDSAGGTVESARFLSGGGTTVTISPDSPLEFDSVYRILVSNAVEDTVGNPFDAEPDTPGQQSFSSSFRTQQETIPPRVVAMLLDGPVDDVPIETEVRVVFSEPIDPATVGATTFALLRGEVEVPSTRTVATSGDTATLVPDAALLHETDYEVFVGGVRDLVGNLLDQDSDSAGTQAYSAAFRTEEDEISPFVHQSMPPDGASNVDPETTLRLIFSEPMDLSSFFPADPGLWRDGFPVSTARTAEPGDASFLFESAEPLVPGATYEWRAGTQLQDKNGNYLDQDPGTPSGDPFSAIFTVSNPPIADAGDGVCSDSALTVTFDARNSSDADGEIVEIIWEWGDGTADTLTAADLLMSHTYPCLDDAGCDGEDNDVDGSIDEELLPDGCDESYRVVLTVIDDDGLQSQDQTGVSFCAFRVLSTDPDSGAVGVDTLAAPRVTLTRAYSPATLLDGVQLFRDEDGTYVAGSVSPEQGNTQVVITPSSPLEPDTVYRIQVTVSLHSSLGEPFDQEPCFPGQQEFVARFRTVSRPPPPVRPPADRTPPSAVSRGDP